MGPSICKCVCMCAYSSKRDTCSFCSRFYGLSQVCVCARHPSLPVAGCCMSSGNRATMRDSLSYVHARMLKHAHAHVHREGHIVWASDISSKTNGCNFVNPCGLAFDLEREQEFLFARACISASTVCVGKQCQRVCASLRQTGRLLVADHGNNAVVRIQFAPIYAPELQARSHAN
jgi:hypothetical protein